MTVIEIYALEQGLNQVDSEFYNELQNNLNKICKNDIIIVLGDFNTRTENPAVQDVLGNNAEILLDINGKISINVALFN